MVAGQRLFSIASTMFIHFYSSFSQRHTHNNNNNGTVSNSLLYSEDCDVLFSLSLIMPLFVHSLSLIHHHWPFHIHAIQTLVAMSRMDANDVHCPTIFICLSMARLFYFGLSPNAINIARDHTRWVHNICVATRTAKATGIVAASLTLSPSPSRRKIHWKERASHSRLCSVLLLFHRNTAYPNLSKTDSLLLVS